MHPAARLLNHDPTCPSPAWEQLALTRDDAMTLREDIDTDPA